MTNTEERKLAKGKAEAVAPQNETKANQNEAKPAGVTEVGTLRAESKGAKVLEMIRQPPRVTRAELMRSTGGRSHNVRRFLSRSLGIATSQAATVAKQRAPDAPGKASTKKAASPQRGAPQGRKLTKRKAKAVAAKKNAKANQKAAKPAGGTEARPRAESKGAKILAMIRRPQGATLAELMRVTGWQAHSVRGFLSGSVGKKMGLTVESFKNPQGERTYRLPA